MVPSLVWWKITLNIFVFVSYLKSSIVKLSMWVQLHRTGQRCYFAESYSYKHYHTQYILVEFVISEINWFKSRKTSPRLPLKMHHTSILFHRSTNYRDAFCRTASNFTLDIRGLCLNCTTSPITCFYVWIWRPVFSTKPLTLLSRLFASNTVFCYWSEGFVVKIEVFSLFILTFLFQPVNE